MATDQERADAVGAQQTEASNKLDYFILGVSIAVCAYLGQTNPYAPVGFNEATFRLTSLLIFAGSAVCGFRRIEERTQLMLANANALGSTGRNREDWYRKGELRRLRMILYYRSRNRLSFLGLACYLVTKVWATYQINGWIPVGA